LVRSGPLDRAVFAFWLSVQNGARQLPPAAVPPTAIRMRPHPAHNPTIESVEELSDVGSLVMMAPTPQYRVQFLDQLPGLQRYASLGKLAHLIHEALDRFLSGIGVQLPRPTTTADLARWQPKLLAALDLVPQKLESLPRHDPRFLRMQLHTQLAQNPKRGGYRRPRLLHGCAGDYPIIPVPCESISSASHFLRDAQNIVEIRDSFSIEVTPSLPLKQALSFHDPQAYSEA